MKKMLILTVLVVVMLALFVGTAFAGSWWVVNSNKVNSDVPYWNTNSEGLTWALDTIEWGASADRSERFYYRNNGGTSATAKRLSINSVASFGPSDQDTLSNGNPHGGFSTTTGYCKTCHAVHEAGADSYRLLKSGSTSAQITAQGAGADRTSGEGLLSVYSGSSQSGNAADAGFGTDRSNECMYCHDADAGFSPMRPYALSILTIVRGEHTVGATHVPDRAGQEMVDRDPYDGDGADANYGTLQCYMCHSVHGAKTLGEATVGNSKWGNKIVRLDPNNDGVDLAQSGVDAAPPITHGTVGGEDVSLVTKESNNNIARTAFCVDCHRANSNWDTGADGTADWVGGAADVRPNPESHIQGPADDGTLEVYGTDMKVAWDDLVTDDSSLDLSTATEGDLSSTGSPKSGCRGCHSADDHGTEQKDHSGLQGTWPHQTIGPKLLNDALGLMNIYGDDIVRSEENNAEGNDAGVIGDADRQLINMDAICLRCHRDNKGGLITADTAGVGITF